MRTYPPSHLLLETKTFLTPASQSTNTVPSRDEIVPAVPATTPEVLQVKRSKVEALGEVDQILLGHRREARKGGFWKGSR